MGKRRFRIVGIQEPGKVDVYPLGIVNLYACDDDQLEKIKNATGCDFIQPEVDAPEPTKEISLTRKVNRKTRSKKGE